MVNQQGAAPEEGELVVATITNVKQNGAYADLDEFEGIEGFIFIGEIASGWVKNIRGFVREGQRVICKVMRTRRDGTSLELSLKSVSEERRRDRLQEWKTTACSATTQGAREKIGWSEDRVAEQTSELTDEFGSLYGTGSRHARSALENAGFEGDWLTSFIEIAVENIIPPFVEVQGTLTLSINVNDGVSVIRSALELQITVKRGTGNRRQVLLRRCTLYRIELKAPDFKVAETIWEQATQAVVGHMSAAGGEAHAERGNGVAKHGYGLNCGTFSTQHLSRLRARSPPHREWSPKIPATLRRNDEEVEQGLARSTQRYPRSKPCERNMSRKSDRTETLP